MTPNFCLLDEQAQTRIVAEAMRILEEVGLLIDHAEALALLDGAGAHIDGGRVYLSTAMVEKALASAPRRIVIYNRHGQPAMDLGQKRIHFNPGSSALRILDGESGQVRTPQTADLVNLARLTDALPNFAAQSTGLVSGDVPEQIGDCYRLYIALLNSPKPIVTGTFRLEGFRPMHDMLALVVGGAEHLRQRPLAIFDCCPTSPLKWTALGAQVLIDCARSGLPVEIVATPLAGATAPVTLAGAVVQHCAENLSGLVIHQLAAAGAPVIYGGCGHCFDMRHGTTPTGAIETIMLQSACAQVGQHLGLPTHGYLGLSDAKVVDFQAGAETALGAGLAALAGINNVSGPGMIEFINCQSLEKLVLDHEICGQAQRLAAGLTLRDEELALPTIRAGLARGEFLSLEHTLHWFRHEAYFPHQVIDRTARDDWRTMGSQDAWQRAQQRTRDLLHRHRPAPLADGLASQLTSLMAEVAQREGLGQLPR